MDSFIFFIIILISFTLTKFNRAESNTSFDLNYYAYWGFDHFKLLESQEEVQLLIDQSSGSGFKSRQEYKSGLFHIKMKTPQQKTGGIVPNFYLISSFDSTHDELDLEFMGTRGLLQTNIFIGGLGGREQRFQLPFDPSQDFHTYTILWNQQQIVFLVDDNPIRVFKNRTSQGVKYPTKAMHIEGTVWNGSWAGQVDWSLGPFIVQYQDYSDITGCSTNQYPSVGECFSSRFFWNGPPYLDLDPQQKQNLENARRSWLVYDYCHSKTSRNYPECSIPDQ